MQTIETERLILRSWKMEDAADVFEYAKGDKVGPMAGWPPHQNIEGTQRYLSMCILEDDTWAVVLKENGKVIGSVGLHATKKENMPEKYNRELGYVLSEDYWGNGYIPEACSAVIDYFFDVMHGMTLIVSHFLFNTQSKRVIEKLGFKYLCRLENSWERFDGEMLSEDVYIMKRDER